MDGEITNVEISSAAATTASMHYVTGNKTTQRATR